MRRKKGIIAVDLFCGAGGLTRGLLDAGIKVKKGFDIDPKLKDTFEKNNDDAKFYCVDVRNIGKEDVLGNLDLENNYLLLAGCAPCQPFSEINKKNPKNDKRKDLLLEFGRLIEETEPDFIFVENVPGLKKGRGRLIFRKFEKILIKNKYFYKSDILDAKDFGVPQKRKRFILLASKYASVEIPLAIHGSKDSGKKPYITVREAISKYPIIRAGKKHKEIPNHECQDLKEINKLRLKYIRKNGGSRLDLPDHLKLKCHSKHDGHTDVYGRMSWDDVSPTLTCKCTSISNGRFSHPTQARGISIREAAALQTFEDDYIFYGNLTDITKWIGNAVPVRFSKVFGDYFIKNIREEANGFHRQSDKGNKS